MRAGRTRHRVVLEVLQKVVDETGGQRDEYVPIGSIWMALEPIRVKEALQSDALLGITVIRGVSRYREGLDITNRIKWNDRLFEVQGIPKNIDERGFELEWDLREITLNG